MQRASSKSDPAVLAAFAVLTLAALLAATISCGDTHRDSAPRDLLLITIDTARADRFSYTGQSGPGTPRIDALAEQGAGFTRAFTPVPLTLPAHASLLTGRQPPSHTVRDNGTYRLPQAETTLAEIMAGAGFSTAAFVGAQVLDARYGLDQGFAHYDDRIPEPPDSTFLYYAERRGDQVVAAASRWLDAQGEEPLFAWVHLFDPHTPYRPPEPERSRHRSAYDGEIAYVDRVVGELIDHWERRRGLDRTLVIVTSDHGEGLGEHDEATHGVLVHDSTLRVPLVIRAPGLRRERSVEEPVSLIDVLPTVLGLFELPVPGGVQGRDLGPLLRGGTIPWAREAGYAESLYALEHHGCAPLISLRDERWKLIRGAAEELYDVAADPGELTDRAGAESQRRDAMSADLQALAAELVGGQAETLELDEKSRRALEALGYVWSRPATPADPGSPVGDAALRDPREALRSMRLMADADRAARRGDLDASTAAYRAVIAAEPVSIDARIRLAQILVANDRGAEALALLAEAVELAPHEPLLHRKLGRALEAKGSFEQALAAYDAGLALHTGERDLRDGRWRCLNQLGRLREMLAEAEQAVTADPTDGMARFARAVACCSHPLSAYVAALERELAELPGDPVLQTALEQARTASN